MLPPIAPIQVPTFGKYHYFFYGMCTEDQISPMLATAEKYGCEFMQMIPMQVQVQSSRLALANGRNQPQVVTVYRLFVRCFREAFPTIKEYMEKDAKLEAKEGFTSP